MKLHEYATIYGWERINFIKDSIVDRVDRDDFDSGKVYTKIDEMHDKKFKDAHICKEIFKNECWFKVWPLLEFLLDSKKFEIIKSYRLKFLDLIRESNDLGTSKQVKAVQDDTVETEAWETKFGIDITSNWTRRYPFTYTGRRPNFVNWDNTLSETIRIITSNKLQDYM